MRNDTEECPHTDMCNTVSRPFNSQRNELKFIQCATDLMVKLTATDVDATFIDSFMKVTSEISRAIESLRCQCVHRYHFHNTFARCGRRIQIQEARVVKPYIVLTLVMTFYGVNFLVAGGTRGNC